MALGKIHHLDFFVDDLDKTVKYLTEKLGFRVVWGREGMKRLVTPNGEELFEFRQLDDNFSNASPSDLGRIKSKDELFRPYLAHIAFEVDDLQKTCDEMKSKGVPFKTGDGPNFNSETGGGEATTYDENGRRWIQMMQIGKDDKKDIAKKQK